MIFAATNTNRAIGLVLLAVVVVGVLTYFTFNQLAGKKEVGSEIELAPNRKPYYDDDTLETTRLDKSLTYALITLGVTAVALPVYWLAEPARQEGAIGTFDRVFTSRGSELYEANCTRCHGPGGVGGGAAFTVTDPGGGFLAQVNWNAPALTMVLSRFDEDEVRHILEYGRGVMPAWGISGGGPLTIQQIDELIFYLRSVQITDLTTVEETVMDGVTDAAVSYLQANDGALAAEFEQASEAVADAADELSGLDENANERRKTAAADALAAAQTALSEVNAQIEEAAGELVAEISTAPAGSDEQLLYGEFLFGNSASNGQYSCARCHSAGWSYGARNETTTQALLEEWPKLESSGVLTSYRPGAGFFGPSLLAISQRYSTAELQERYISEGGRIGAEDSNQMPGFGGREDAGLVDDEGNPTEYLPSLSPEQIAAIVAYERSLGSTLTARGGAGE